MTVRTTWKWTALVFVLLLNVAVIPVKVQAENSSPGNSMTHIEFDRKFRADQNLGIPDFAVFPEPMRWYLLAYKKGDDDRYHSAFSQKIAKRTYLIVFNREGIPGNISKAVLLERLGKTVSPQEGMAWQPLYLPTLKRKQNGWAVLASDFHFNLEWLDDLKAVQTTYCGDVMPVSCMRQKTKVYPGEMEMLSVEVYSARLGDWTPIYVDGLLLPTPTASRH